MLRPEDALSLLAFSGRVQLAVSPVDSRERAHEVIEGDPGADHDLPVDASYAAVVAADSTRGRPLALIFSDGEDQGSWLDRNGFCARRRRRSWSCTL